MAKKTGKDELQPIIIKRVKKSAAGHHGGAWKVAYADFVTAMMAFFLMLWLLNVSTDDALQVISSYFDPSHARVSRSESGAGGVMGGLSMSREGAMIDSVQPISAPQPQTARDQGESEGAQKGQNALQEIEQMLRREEDQRFEEAKRELEQALADNPELRELAEHLIVDITPEGLRIQIVDREGAPMFPSGSADMYQKTKDLLALATRAVRNMPNDISVRGHTDSHQYAPGARYSNWELSADRANSSRRVMLESGADQQKIVNVMGKADTDHLVEDNPYDARNRRITVMLLRETLAQAYERGALDNRITPGEAQQIRDNIRDSYEIEGYQPLPRSNNAPDRTFQRSPGSVYFP